MSSSDENSAYEKNLDQLLGAAEGYSHSALSALSMDAQALAPIQQHISHAILCSPYIKRLLAADARLLGELAQNLYTPWTQAAMQTWLEAQTISDESSLKQALRQLRLRVMLRLMTRDLNGLADLAEVMQGCSDLAQTTVQFALLHLTPWLEAVYGVAIGESGKPQQLIVVGMGKLGGYELNVSSDIDLIFAFEEDGETNGTQSLSNHEFFARLGKKLIAAIDDITPDGFVFRVDMRLRPYGSEGPLACSFAMLEEYYQNQGREWERYAWIKGRVIAGPEAKLVELLKPFVFRKYLDYGAFASMRDLKVQIQRDVNRRDADQGGQHDNIKLGRGGIREVEFIAQVFQLIRGGQDASLQIKPTLKVLQLLGDKRLLPETTVAQLSEGYIFLRNLEHRLQYQENAQTQTLPTQAEAQARIALSMNFTDWVACKAALDKHRQAIDGHFKQLFSDPQANVAEEAKPETVQLTEIWQASVGDALASARLLGIGYAEPEETLRRLHTLQRSSKYQQLPELSRQRYDKLMPAVIALAAQEAMPAVTLNRVTDIMESICRRASYLALLAEYPNALQLVVKLAAASPWLAQYLAQHPIVLDELLNAQYLYAAPDFVTMRADLSRRMQELTGDIERQMDVMRHFKHAAVFKLAAQDVAGELDLTSLSDYLSELANLILQVTMDTLWPHIKGKHREQPAFAIIGYGKLGGRELGYASDLDIIFLYDDEAPEAAEVYARFGQRINNWLNSLTSAGMLYETDLQLRPDGASGLLVSSVAAFKEYQLHKAWVWEHQALTRAAFSAGDVHIGVAFAEIRYAVLRQSRDSAKLKQEVLDMRQRMRLARPDKRRSLDAPVMFDLKQGYGGIIDVEFMVQYLVLAHAAEYPSLVDNIGNIALLERLADCGLLDLMQAQQVANAYYALRKLQHAMRLQGEPSGRVAMTQVEPYAGHVQALWQELFESEAKPKS
jgi:[glutamine synthetase] adenylyltransferase / [glutamine synthetase]-adenylyl-L-tyrosine phosphorylase